MPSRPLSLVLRAAAAAILSVAATADAGLIYNQTADYPSNFNALTSQSQATGGKFESYDNFTIAGGGAGSVSVAAVTFQGFYWNPTGPTVNPPALPPLQNLQLGFYTNSGGFPGTFLGSTTLTDFGFSRVGSSNFGPDNTGKTDTVDIYNFRGNLSTPFTATLNVSYWLSFVSFAPSSPVIWLWTSASGGDGKSAQFQYGTNFYSSVTRDRTFALYDAKLGLFSEGPPSDELPSGELVDTPEPGTLALGMIGVTCVAGLRLRRRNTAT